MHGVRKTIGFARSDGAEAPDCSIEITPWQFEVQFLLKCCFCMGIRFSCGRLLYPICIGASFVSAKIGTITSVRMKIHHLCSTNNNRFLTSSHALLSAQYTTLISQGELSHPILARRGRKSDRTYRATVVCETTDRTLVRPGLELPRE